MNQAVTAPKSKRHRLARMQQRVARIGNLPARDSSWDELTQLVVALIVAAAFIALLAGPALRHYLQATRSESVPFTGLWRPSVESFVAVGLIILMAIILSRFPWFLYTSFQNTKKARMRGELWIDLEALGYTKRLCHSGWAEQRLNTYAGATKTSIGEGRTSNVAASQEAFEYSPSVDAAMIAFTKRFEDSYGHRPFRGPLLSLTILYLIGWLTVVLPNGLSALPAQAAAGSVPPGMAGVGLLISNGMKGYVSQVAANLSVVSAAFLGAYIFSVTSLFRRYLRSDFKPTAITQSCLRFVTAVIAGFLLGLMPSDLLRFSRVPGVTGQDLLLVVAFFMGIFALNGVSAIWELTVKTIPELSHAGKGLKPSELTELDGLDAWHEDRLNEAGIDSVRALANADFLDLLIHVRIPTQTLVDWVDQAVLRIHCTSSTWSFLLKHTSIRSASDMLTFLGDPNAERWLLDVVHQVKGSEDEPHHLGDAEIQMLKNTLSQEPNAIRVRNFWASHMADAKGSPEAAGDAHPVAMPISLAPIITAPANGRETS